MVGVDGFWPAVDVNRLRNTVRLGDGVVSHERLVGAIEGAVGQLVIELADWRAMQEAAGAADLAQVAPGNSVNGDPLAEVFWQRAVRYLAAAELADGHADLTATDTGTTRAQEKRAIADDYRRMATTAIGSLLRLGAQDTASPRVARTGGILVDLV